MQLVGQVKEILYDDGEDDRRPNKCSLEWNFHFKKMAPVILDKCVGMSRGGLMLSQ